MLYRFIYKVLDSRERVQSKMFIPKYFRDWNGILHVSLYLYEAGKAFYSNDWVVHCTR